ncbi:MAG TPA: Uma2 family endonuclease [Gemmataceae bacterium]|nr:Uma2 family endonuclease [Gemmataceae bacterium]
MVVFWDEARQRSIEVPSWVNDLESFRRWSDDKSFPEEGRIYYLDGKVWVDMSKEEIFAHVGVKTAIALVLAALVRGERMGQFYTDGVYVSNVSADISNKPDGLFISRATIRSKRVRFTEGVRGGYIELEGSPDMVLEIVSDSSVKKDKIRLREKYWKARVKEYWLVDARGENLQFEVYRRTPRGYRPQRHRDGWVESKVYGKSFRLVRALDEDGHPEFTLEMK